MSHPPIPKCKWFVKTDGGTWALTYRDAAGCIDDFINIEPIEELGWIPDESIRYFAACVAEIEWMKVAEEAMAKHGLVSCETCCADRQSQKYEIYEREVRPALKNAEAWRLWASQ